MTEPIFTEFETQDTKGAVRSTEDAAMRKLYKSWEDAKHKEWPAPVKWVKALERATILEPKIEDLPEDVARVVVFVMAKARELELAPPYTVVKPKVPVAAVVALPPSSSVVSDKSFVIKEGKIVREFDVMAFKKSVAAIKPKFNMVDLRSEALGAVADVDFFALLQEILKEEEAVWLIAILGLRLVVPPNVRADMDKLLVEIAVLTNRGGVLSQGLVRMGGYITLGCCKDEPLLAKVLSRNPNPLLGQDVTNRPVVRKKGETDVEFTSRSNTQAANFALYKTVHDSVKVYAMAFQNMDPVKKAEIKAEFMRYFVV